MFREGWVSLANITEMIRCRLKYNKNFFSAVNQFSAADQYLNFTAKLTAMSA